MVKKLPDFFMLDKKDLITQIKPEIISKFGEKSGMLRLKSTMYGDEFKEQFIQKKPSVNESKNDQNEWVQLEDSVDDERKTENLQIYEQLAPSRATLRAYQKNSLRQSGRS